MKITITETELTDILVQHLNQQGMRVDPGTVTFNMPLDPAYDPYDNPPAIFRGITFELIKNES